MTIVDIDIWRAVNLLVQRHGRDAAIVAAQRADECLASGDVEGQAVWKRIVEAILELLRASLRTASRSTEPGYPLNSRCCDPGINRGGHGTQRVGNRGPTERKMVRGNSCTLEAFAHHAPALYLWHCGDRRVRHAAHRRAPVACLIV